MLITAVVDANHKLGMGHLYRQKALALELKKRGNDVVFAVPNKKEAIFQIKKLKLKFTILQGKNNSQTFIDSLLKKMTLTGSRITLVDGVILDRKQVNRIKLKDKIIVTFDNYVGNEDLSISPFEGVKKSKRQLTGYDWLILNENFNYNEIVHKNVAKKVKKVFLSQGGSDTFGGLPFLIDKLSGKSDGMQFDIHIGSAFKHFKELDKSLNNFPSRYKIQKNVRNIKKVMEKADLAVSAAGITAFELLSLGIPTIIYTREPKELNTANMLSKLKIAKYVKSDELGKAFDELTSNYKLRKTLSKKSQQIIKGSKVFDVAKEILKLTDLSSSNKIHL